MELFYAYEVSGRYCRLDAEESGHCVRVLRHRTGDEIDVIDGLGTLYHCRLTLDSPKGAEAEILDAQEGFGGHPYHLTIGCCPTKNNDRFEWFVEKATELGVDRIVPLIGDHSERKVYKTERAQRIALAATKQSLKARIPEIAEPVSVRDFILQHHCVSPYQVAQQSDRPEAAGDNRGQRPLKKEKNDGLLAIAYCFEDASIPRRSLMEVLKEMPGPAGQDERGRDITVLIGPEGDFSPEEARLALEHGFIPIHLGPSRLRTETAAVTAAEAVYLSTI
jgi:16S rRNA (uracil1498-N3)-methyltransferase